MFSNILCPVDFTTFSHQALETAVAIARSYGAAVTGVFVADKDHPSATDGWRRPWTTSDLPGIQAQLLKVLQEVKAPSPQAVAVLGTPAVEIEKLARALPADLVVLPLCGRTGQREHAYGSVTAHVMGHAAAPVLVVPGGESVARRSSPPDGFHRIACGINFSPASLKALRYGSDLAAARQGHLFVTYVLSANDAVLNGTKDPDSVDRQDATSLWSRRLHAAAHTDLPEGVQVHDQLCIGDAAGELLRLAQEERCDLIVIGGHRGHPPGCVMSEVLERARCPVLTVRMSR